MNPEALWTEPQDAQTDAQPQINLVCEIKPVRVPHSNDWPADRIEQLKGLWERGFSGSQIAAEMGGLTRNAVIGKAHRLGLSKRITTKARPYIRKRLMPTAMAKDQPEFRDEPVRLADEPDIIAVGKNQCRWPVGVCEYDRHLFCGHVTPSGASYCGFHNLKSYNQRR